MEATENPVELHRLTVNLVPKAFTALQDAARLSQLSKTDTVNRALQLYAFIVKITVADSGSSDGGHVFVREAGDDHRMQRITFL